MPATPQTPSNPDQKDQGPWQKRLQGWWQKKWQDWRGWIKSRPSQINTKIWKLDWAITRYNKRFLIHLDNFSLWVKKFPRNRPGLISLCIAPFVLAFIFLCRELFIAIFPLSAIAIEPFLLSFWHATLALGLLAISGLIFFWFIPQVFGWLAKIISGVWFLFILVIIFSLLFAFSVLVAFSPLISLPDHIAEIINIRIIGPAFGLIFGFLLFAQRLDMMNKQADIAQRQHESEQFKQASELLAHKNMVARMGGITLLGTLARTRPKKWHVKAVDVLALFIRQRSIKDDESPVKEFWQLVHTEEKDEKEAKEKWQELSELKKNKAPDDIEAAIRVIACDLTKEQKTVIKKHHKKVKRWPDLERCWLCRINMTGAYLQKALLSESFLTRTNLSSSDLSGAIFTSSHLDSSVLTNANVISALFSFTNLASVDFLTVKGLGEGIFSKSYYIKGEWKPASLGGFTPSGKFEEVKLAEQMEIKDYWKEAHDFSERRHFFATVPRGTIISGRTLREGTKERKRQDDGAS